jgi:hypothetical protein
MRVLDDAGTPVAGAEVDGVRWAEFGDRYSLSVPHVARGKSGSAGFVDVDVPCFDHDLVSVSVRSGPRDQVHREARSRPIRLKAGQVQGPDVRLRSAPAGAAEGEGVGGFVGVGGSPDIPRPERPGSLRLRLVDSDGRALGRAALVVHDGRDHDVVTDAAGIASVEGLVPGAARVFVVDETLRPAAVNATVVAGETTSVEVAEPKGRDLDVVVTHEDGSAVAAATVSCRTRTREYRPIPDGTWRTMLTDHTGRLRIPGAPAGPLTIVVEYGSRVVRTPVERDAPSEVRVEIPAAAE